jgi:hypothetical protein
MLYTTTFMFTNLDFIHTGICYGILNENNHQEYSVLLVTVHTLQYPKSVFHGTFTNYEY